MVKIYGGTVPTKKNSGYCRMTHKVNSVDINLRSYYNNFINLHIFSLTDMGDFECWICKIDTFFYFAMINTNALTSNSTNRVQLSLVKSWSNLNNNLGI